MIKLASDIAKDIRTELKELGFNSKKVSVRKKDSNAVVVTLKDESIDREAIEQVAYKHQDVGYCEVSGEILAGGNTYVSVK